VPLDIHGHKVSPGTYGVSIDDRHRFVVTDLSGGPIFVVDSECDLKLFRPTPLQIRPGAPAHDYRFYLGRDYITLFRVGRPGR